jgi:hypothetical protein
MSKGATELPKFAAESFWVEVGRGSAAVYGKHEDWLYRRVETIEFVGRRSVKRNISVDFKIPSGLPRLDDAALKDTVLVPISVLHKWPPLMNFDFIGPNGLPTSRYLGTTNKQLDFGLLLGMAGRALLLGDSQCNGTSRRRCQNWSRRRGRAESETLAPTLMRELKAIVQSPNPTPTLVAQAVNGLSAELNRRLGVALQKEWMKNSTELATRMAVTVDLAARLAGSSILWIAVDGRPETDQIVKFSYLDASRESMPDAAPAGEKRRSMQTRLWWAKWQTACSWRCRTIAISLPHAGRHVRYHLDILAPHGGVEPIAVEAMAFPSADGEKDPEVSSVETLAGQSKALDTPDEWVGPDSSRYFMAYGEPISLASTDISSGQGDVNSGTDQQASVVIVDRRTHLYLGPRSAPSHRVLLQIKLAAPRQGFVFGCMVAAWTIAVLMAAILFRLKSVAVGLEATVVLLAVVPVVLGSLLARPGENELERYHIAGVRLMAMVSGATPILGALALILTHPHVKKDIGLLELAWLVLVIIGVLMAAGLTFSYLRSPRTRTHQPSR